MKRFAVLLLILVMASISNAFMLADFETGLDGFEAINSPLVTLSNPAEPEGAITSGTHCLKIATAGSNYWSLRWTPATIPTRLGKLSFDTTMFADDWPTQPWTKFPDKLALQINGGWQEVLLNADNWKWRDPSVAIPCPADWGAWDGDAAKTCTVDLSSYSLAGATSFDIVISINCGTAGIFYLDNFHIIDEPHDPDPADDGVGVVGGTDILSWVNAIDSLEYVQVWFGEITAGPTEPNYPSEENYKTQLSMISKIANPGATSSAAIPAIEDGKTYAWLVEGFIDCGDPNNNTEPNYPGLLWTFTATTNAPPVPNAGEDQYKWLNEESSVSVTLDGSGTTDDGKAVPLTYSWTQTAGVAVTINSVSSAVATVTLTELGNTTETDAGAPYVFQLEVYDGYWTKTDTVTVYLNSDSCRASIEAGGYYYYGDIAGPDGAGYEYRDCKIDMYDFAELAINWLGCTNTFEGCD